jgi:hypothetical protein
MTTVQTLIDDALIDLGKHTIGDTVHSGMYDVYLRRLNGLLSGWSNQFHMQYQPKEVIAPLTGAASYTISATGQIVAPKPIALITAQYQLGDQRYNLRVVKSQEEWSRIYRQESLSGTAECVFLDAEHPTAKIHVYPKMSGANLILNYYAPLTKFTAITNQVDLPEGLEELIVAELAIILAPGLGTTASNETKQRAQSLSYAFKRINATVPTLCADYPDNYRGSGYSTNMGGGSLPSSYISLIVTL